jgi:hypothetical protein
MRQSGARISHQEKVTWCMFEMEIPADEDCQTAEDWTG